MVENIECPSCKVTGSVGFNRKIEEFQNHRDDGIDLYYSDSIVVDWRKHTCDAPPERGEIFRKFTRFKSALSQMRMAGLLVRLQTEEHHPDE